MHVFEKCDLTLDQLIDWVRSVEPEDAPQLTEAVAAQVANDDTEGMAYIDKYAQAVLANGGSSPSIPKKEMVWQAVMGPPGTKAAHLELVEKRKQLGG
jgi:hypothetical protein